MRRIRGKYSGFFRGIVFTMISVYGLRPHHIIRIIREVFESAVRQSEKYMPGGFDGQDAYLQYAAKDRLQKPAGAGGQSKAQRADHKQLTGFREKRRAVRHSGSFHGQSAGRFRVPLRRKQ